MKCVTLIPARGGSKGIPGKNLYKICGKPLLTYTIEASLGSIVQETWVSSDSTEILNFASSKGAHCIKRPPKFATDDASSEDALLHFAEHVDFDILVFLQATSPLIQSSDIDAGINLMNSYDSIVGVTENTQFSWVSGQPQYDLSFRKRRQDLGQTFLENGSIYITTKDQLLRSKTRVSGDIGFLEMPKIRSFEIDCFEDIEIVELVMNQKLM